MRATILVGIVAALGGACSSEGVSPRSALMPSASRVTLRYSAFSGRLRPLLTGTLELVVHDDSTIAGSWVIDWVPGADTTTPVGPQVGQGALEGRLRSDATVVLNLNPHYADNNALLTGIATNDGLCGTWEWSGIAGPLSRGRFTASQ